jgi:zinc transport system ATP-binding protein
MLMTSTATTRPERPREGDTPVVSLRAASFGYGERAVVDGVSLDVRRGEVVAVLGPNGSGKSTLVRGVLGLVPLLKGSVRLFGADLDDFSERSRVGYVPQRHTLGASVHSTVEEIVEIGRLPHRRWWAPWRRSPVEDQAIVVESLDTVGLADRAGSDVTALSGGQQRRVLIARALAAQPEVLVMDEPTAGVDIANQRVLSDVLARLVERGSTMVIVTHELAAISDIVTRVVLVRSGQVVFDGEPAAYRSVAGPSGNDHHHDEEAGRRHLPGSPGPGPLDTTSGGDDGA